MRILIIDDSEDGREIGEAMLASAGYTNITAVDSAKAAYRFLDIGGPPTTQPSMVDLILLDIMMPEIDGIEACAHIHNEKRYASVPIIMVTSLADAESLANAFIAGATDYITKPLNRVELRARVRSALKLKAEFDRREARENELMNLMSTPDDRHALNCIDAVTGLFLGEVAEGYLAADANFPDDTDTTVIGITVDRFDAYRSAVGVEIAAGAMRWIARAVRGCACTVGAVASVYRDGVIVLVIPELAPDAALELGEALRVAISNLRIANPESIVADQLTVSVAVVTDQTHGSADRLHLLSTAISAVASISADGGNRALSEPA